jgi:hypothetical protein
MVEVRDAVKYSKTHKKAKNYPVQHGNDAEVKKNYLQSTKTQDVFSMGHKVPSTKHC